jgi:hypothetical protein
MLLMRATPLRQRMMPPRVVTEPPTMMMLPLLTRAMKKALCRARCQAPCLFYMMSHYAA